MKSWRGIEAIASGYSGSTPRSDSSRGQPAVRAHFLVDHLEALRHIKRSFEVLLGTVNMPAGELDVTEGAVNLGSQTGVTQVNTDLQTLTASLFRLLEIVYFEMK